MEDIKVGSIVKYIGDYDNCHNIEYKVKYVWNGFKPFYYDLEISIPRQSNDYTVYKELLSVPEYEIKLVK